MSSQQSDLGTETDPFEIFRTWYAEALASQERQPDAMALATATRDGKPSSRLVLLKGVEAGEFQFFTNYESRKARELDSNPFAALTFFWPSLHRQVRIEGGIRRLSAAQSDAYWKTRPRDSQLSSAASSQSKPIESYDVLARQFAELAARYQGQEVPRPAHWGGYALLPERIEFWVAQKDRLHWRVLYQRSASGWEASWISP